MRQKSCLSLVKKAEVSNFVQNLAHISCLEAAGQKIMNQDQFPPAGKRGYK